MLKKVLYFLTVVSLLLSLGCSSEPPKPKTYFSATEDEWLTTEQLKASLIELDKLPKSEDKKTIVKNNALRASIQYYINKNNEKDKKTTKKFIDRKAENFLKYMGIVASDITVAYLPDYDYKGNLAVQVACKLQNLSNQKITPYTVNYFLRKKNNNSFEIDYWRSGFYKVSAEEKFSNIDLLPGDTVQAIFSFKTNIKDKTANGWYICTMDKDYENILLTIDNSMRKGQFDFTKIKN